MNGKYLLDTNIVIALFAGAENDIWIAALAIEHSLTLVSRDEHFKQIDELKRAAW
jgi:predicted nucleic acid-binding protein